nr:winged helix-turn-helix transcriptional regulator [Halosolutus halophilus]
MCLDELTEKGLIERRSFDEIPPRVEYSLTPRGRELETRIQPLLEWAAEEG